MIISLLLLATLRADVPQATPTMTDDEYQQLIEIADELTQTPK